MIIGTDPISSLPVLTEDRPLGLYRALPRSIQNYIRQLDDSPWTVDYAKTDLNTGAIMLACCKCGRALNGWHPVADRAGRGVILPDGRAAVAMGPLNHYRETRYAAFLPRLHATVHYTVLHCADCVIADEHRQDTLAIHLAAHDQQQMARRQMGQAMLPAQWAQECWKWGDVDVREKVSGPLGPHEGV